MEKKSPFLIYDAAAGSGKTFTLVKEYLKQILSHDFEGHYKQLLAITFTNKAVAEMKQRIVDTLVKFSEAESTVNPTPMMEALAEETGLSEVEIQHKSQKILKHLLHNYAAFSVETIDRFNHRLIRTFARDLKLATNFEITLDINQLLTEAVDLLLSKAGQDEAITKVLLDFALEKTDDDKSWDISKDIVAAAGLLYSENEAPQVSILKQKTLQDFLQFKNELLQAKKSISANLVQIASETLLLIDDNGLEHSDFSSGYLPKYFQKIASSDFGVGFGLKWQDTMADKPLYPARVSASKKAIIDSLAPVFVEKFEQTKQAVIQLWLIDSILANLNPLSVINLVNQEIENIKNEKNILPISEFNALINSEIKNQPAPFIYERLGEKYRHFFIDEFQDTSKLQWENLIPLIDNTLSQQTDAHSGSLLLVGDAKQSIYRWRGGLPEQFIRLNLGDNPFTIKQEVLNLDTNYRSCREIIDFNNQFFTFISKYFANPAHTSLYEIGNKQKCNERENGFVKLEFIEGENKNEKTETYCELVYQTILEVKEKGFDESDICILTRKKSEGIALGAYLMERDVQVVSSETLLLQSSAIVQILILTLKISLQSKNEEAKIVLLDLLHDQLSISEEKHTFFGNFLNISLEDFSKKLENYEIHFDFSELKKHSLYETFEYCVQQLKLSDIADAYLFGFMDLVLEFEQQSTADKISFLDYWQTKKETASVAAVAGANAVQLMTIHKSKGLEFQVVIFPFADINIYDARKDKVWYPLGEDEYSFTEAQINYKTEISDYGTMGAQLYLEHRSKLELDNLNLLYVALTRAVEKLYIFSEKPSERKDAIPQNYNHFFLEFLKYRNLWNENSTTYSFGTDTEKISKKKEIAFQVTPIYISSNPEAHNLNIISKDALLWNTESEVAISAGNLLHDVMAKIISASDAEEILYEIEQRGNTTTEELQNLRRTVSTIINHPELKYLFDGNGNVFSERDIISKEGIILRPDRLNIFLDNTAVVVDYKTGNESQKHITQINSYANAIEDMGFKVIEKILIYTNDAIVINKV
ncbi:UvrD-helicase domain-containing protein [Aequorivita echinoideorum]|uniref:DNA 3'-5' helicase n=1 Tax=Aequorivita echinoideorum TaxID=1549647 RepID=A0ABS5S1G7_9FLAO|nr:UvrD-helicase domain-containing protein [Aequorivita echinoideorum]MBT0607046.1 UvrD-helicase domain-containing protein [Aequorivita echinoideorum]